MNNSKIFNDYIEASFRLGEELLDKANLTPAEDNFLTHLDNMATLIESN